MRCLNSSDFLISPFRELKFSQALTGDKSKGDFIIPSIKFLIIAHDHSD